MKTRNTLQPYLERRITFRGTFRRFGVRQRDGATTALVSPLTIPGRGRIAHHQWIALGIVPRPAWSPGDQLEFSAVVVRVTLGYHGRDPDRQRACPPREDFRLAELQNVRVVKARAA